MYIVSVTIIQLTYQSVMVQPVHTGHKNNLNKHSHVNMD